MFALGGFLSRGGSTYSHCGEYRGDSLDAVEGILIPVKRLEEAKRRLAARLAPEDRRRLGLAMLADVLRATEKWTARWIVTSDGDAEAVGLAFGCRLVRDEGAGLNPAISKATEIASIHGVESLLVLPSDVPLVSPDEVAALFSLEADVVVASSLDGGTNALLRRPPGAIEPVFGKGSAAAHVRAATEKGLDVVSFNARSLLLDVDQPADLALLAQAESDRESARIARELA